MEESLKNLKSALETYIRAYTIEGKYVGNPNYIEDYERVSMYLEIGGEDDGRSEGKKRKA